MIESTFGSVIDDDADSHAASGMPAVKKGRPVTLETIFENESFSMWYYPDKKIIHHKFHKDFNGPDFRAALERGTAVLKKKGARKWLSDDRAYGALPEEDVVWGMEDWGPKTVMAGWRYWAIVMPKALMSQVSHRTLEANFSRIGVTARVFLSEEDAMSWLEAQ